MNMHIGSKTKNAWESSRIIMKLGLIIRLGGLILKTLGGYESV